ncbi:MAG: hypothetical protein ABW136_04880 [Steroidobacteraceae bacterium]
MVRTTNDRQILLLATACALLAGCGGADEIVSPGTGGDITINNPPAPAPPPPPPAPTGPVLVTPAAGCPTIENTTALADRGTITGPTGTYRVCELPALIDRNTTLTKLPGVLYSMAGRVNVGVDLGKAPVVGETSVTLTIQPGVIVFANTGVSWLAVNRGHKINATGTAALPIIFTSRDNVQGIATDASQGQWGGIVLLGRAPTTDCTVASNAAPGTVDCERQTEGSVDPAYFGGATPADNSGTLRYVQIRYSGYVLSGNSELQALTLGGVGSGTSISYIQSHNSSDDAFENFGGTVSMRRLVLTGADDDTVDIDTGWQGTVQYVIGVQKDGGAADSMIELDSANALEAQTPRTNLKLANFTFVHKNQVAGNAAAILMRGGADATLVNGIMTTPTSCLRLAGANMITTDPAIGKIGAPVFRSVAFQCGATPFVGSSGLTAAQVQTAFNPTATASVSFTNTLANVFRPGASETAFGATDPKTIDPAFDTTAYVGAVRDATDTWYAGWTCNSATANFDATGATGTLCTSLPTN